MRLADRALPDQLVIKLVDLLRTLQGCNPSLKLLRIHMVMVLLQVKLVKFHRIFELLMDSSC